jgi:diguanylate cyclase
MRKQSESPMNARDLLLKATLDNAIVGIVNVAMDGKIMMANPYFTVLLGYSEAELLTMNMGDITHPEDMRETLTGIRQMRDGYVPDFHTEKRYLRKDGSFIWVQLSTQMVRADQSEPLYSVAIVKDISAATESICGLLRSQVSPTLSASKFRFRKSY